MNTGVTREEIERLAYQLWIERGRPEGSPDDDWERAERLLQFSPPATSAADEEAAKTPVASAPAQPEAAPVEIVAGAAYVRPKLRNGGSRRAARA